VGPRLHREVLDTEGERSFLRLGDRGRYRGDTLRTRLVAVRNEVHRMCHTYVTNIPVNTLSVEEVGELYRTHWSVELLFKEARGTFHPDRVATGNRYLEESLTRTSGRAVWVSRRRHNTLLQNGPLRSDFGIRRSAIRECFVMIVANSSRRYFRGGGAGRESPSLSTNRGKDSTIGFRTRTSPD
jgi:IS4 transposase